MIPDPGGRSPSVEEVVARIRTLLSEILRVPPSTLDLDADQDILDMEIVTAEGRMLDSLDLVALIGALEQEYGISVEALVEAEDSLTIRRIAEEVAGS